MLFQDTFTIWLLRNIIVLCSRSDGSPLKLLSDVFEVLQSQPPPQQDVTRLKVSPLNLTSLPPPQLERERQYEIPQAHRSSKPPKDSYLVEQVFSPHPFPPSVKSHMKGSPLYTDLRLTGLSDGNRGQPSWTIEEYKRNSGGKGKELPGLALTVGEEKDQRQSCERLKIVLTETQQEVKSPEMSLASAGSSEAPWNNPETP